MKTLMVAPFAPYRDGIATYAMQELRRLREAGDTVEVLSPLPSAARWHLKLGGPGAMVQLGQRAASYERTVIQFGPELLFGGCRNAGQRVAVWAGLAALARRTWLDIRIHEIEYGPLAHNAVERRMARLALDQADRVTVHTEAERDELDRLLGLGRRIEVVEHGRDFVPTVCRSRADARRELELATDGFVYVAIGFLQHHKGFDLAIEAMSQVVAPDAHLHIVGSARVDHPEIEDYVHQLRAAADRLPAVTLHERFVSDVEFDLWLQASDAVVLPYREIWSSGVLERARLFGTPVVASDLPQLRDQAPDGTRFFSDVPELVGVMQTLATAATPLQVDLTEPGPPTNGGGLQGDTPVEQASWTVDLDRPDKASVQAQIAARARAAELSKVAKRVGVPDRKQPVDALLGIGPLHRPTPTSARPGVAPVKKAIERLIGWQIDPLADRLVELQRATTEAVAMLNQQSAERPDPTSSSTETPNKTPNKTQGAGNRRI